MAFEHVSIEHVRFGAGEILSIEGTQMRVRFADGVERHLAWPDAFKGFVTTSDVELLRQAKRLLDERQQIAQQQAADSQARLAASQLAQRQEKTAARRTRAATARTAKKK